MRSGIFSLLFTNAAYRRLWCAEFISFVGDWFTLIALVRFAHEETGSSLGTGLLLGSQMAPNFLLSSFAGSLADRVPRKKIMITCDVLRAVGALALLAPFIFNIHGTPAVAVILLLVIFQSSLTAVFRPAASACVPNLVKPEELSAAGTLEGLSWSLGLIVGSGLGGLATDALGTHACFLIDSLSFVASALFLRKLALPAAPASRRTVKSGLGDYGELIDELKHNKKMVAPILAKCAWGVGAAQLLLLTEFGDNVLGRGAASTGFGLLYASRGIGTAVGPALARRVFGENDRAIRRSMMLGFAGAAICYFIFGLGTSLPVALLCIAGAHGGGSMIWIGATVLLQRAAPDHVRGRAFGVEMALHTITACGFPLLAAVLLDAGYEPSYLVKLFAVVTAILGGAWSILAVRFSQE